MIGCLSSTRKGLSSMQRRRQQTSRPRVIEKLADSCATLAHWLRQMGMDTSAGQLSFTRLTMTNEFGELFWTMRAMGEQWRMRLTRDLCGGDGYIDHWMDPREYIPYSRRRFILQAATDQHIELMRFSENFRQVVEAVDGKTGRMIYAFLQTWPDNRRPVLFLDEQPPPGYNWEEHEINWTFQAAQVLGQYYTNTGMYHGDMAPAGFILPPEPNRESHMTALLHRFAIALLDLPRECPPHLHCPCRAIMGRAAMVPPRHPEMTGELRLDGRAPTLAPGPRPEDMRQHTGKPTLRTMYERRQQSPHSAPLPQNHPPFPSQPSQPGWGNADPQTTGSRGGNPKHNDSDDTMRLDR